MQVLKAETLSAPLDYELLPKSFIAFVVSYDGWGGHRGMEGIYLSRHFIISIPFFNRRSLFYKELRCINICISYWELLFSTSYMWNCVPSSSLMCTTQALLCRTVTLARTRYIQASSGMRGNELVVCSQMVCDEHRNKHA